MGLLDNVDKLMDFIYQQSIMDTAVKSAAAKTVLIAMLIAGITFFLSLAYNYINTAIKSIKDQSVSFFVDYEEIARTIVIVGLLVIYVPLVNTAVDFVEYFNRLSAPSFEQSQLLQKYAQEYLKSGRIYDLDITQAAWHEVVNDPYSSEELKALAREKIQQFEVAQESTVSQNASLDRGDDVEEKLSGSRFLNPSAWVMTIIKVLTKLLYGIMKPIIVGLAIGVSKVLIVIGPLAFAFSILPAYRKVLEGWASTLLTTLFVFTTINIIEHLHTASLYYIFRDNLYYVGSLASHLVFEATMVVLYTMAFWLTGKVVGRGDGGRVMSKAVGLAASAIGAAAFKGFSAAAGSSSAGSAIKAGANIIGSGNSGDVIGKSGE